MTRFLQQDAGRADQRLAVEALRRIVASSSTFASDTSVMPWWCAM